MPPPKKLANAHVHNGFYLRFGLGVASVSGSIDTPATSTSAAGKTTTTGETAHAKISGASGAFDLAIGGTVYRGLAIAFNASGRSVGGDANVKFDKGQVQRDDFRKNLSVSNIGVMADWYTDPRKGLHVQGGIGFAQVQHEAAAALGGGAGKMASYTGLGLHLGVGYDAFVSEEWSIGGLLRLDTASVSSDGDNAYTPQNTKISVFAPALLFTGTYN